MPKSKVTVVGAGLSGLHCAYFLSKYGFQVRVVEERARPGGLIWTEKTPFGLVESAANAFMNTSLLDDISDDIGVELVPARKASRKRFIYSRSKARRWPLSPFSSLESAWRFLFERKREPRSMESVAEWSKRILGKEASFRLLAPALQGIYAGDIQRMSAGLIFDKFFSSRGKPRDKGPREKGSVAPKGGMGEWMTGLAQHLEKSGVDFAFSTSFSSADYATALERGEDVVLCVAAHQCIPLLSEVAPELGKKMERYIEMISVSSVTVFSPPDDALLEGFGVLFEKGEGFDALGVLFNHHIFDGRSEERSETWIFPGVFSSDEEAAAAVGEGQKRLHGSALENRGIFVNNWPQAFPHYTVGLERLLREFHLEKKAKKRKVYLCGNYLGDLGASKIVDRAQALAKELSR